MLTILKKSNTITRPGEEQVHDQTQLSKLINWPTQPFQLQMLITILTEGQGELLEYFSPHSYQGSALKEFPLNCFPPTLLYIPQSSLSHTKNLNILVAVSTQAV